MSTRKTTLYKNHSKNNISKNGKHLIRRQNSTSATIFFLSCYSFDCPPRGESCQCGHVLQYQQCNNGPWELLLLDPYHLIIIPGNHRAKGRKRLTIVSLRDTLQVLHAGTYMKSSTCEIISQPVCQETLLWVRNMYQNVLGIDNSLNKSDLSLSCASWSFTPYTSFREAGNGIGNVILLHLPVQT